MQYGGDISIDGLFDCILCGACEPVCPEDIDIMAMLIELRRKANYSMQQQSNAQPNPALLQDEWKYKHTNNKPHDVLLLADEALCRHLTLPGKMLLSQVLKLLSDTGKSTVKQAQDNGSDIALALQSGADIASGRIDEFLGSIKHASKLIVCDGLLKRTLQQWLADLEIVSLGYALSSLPSIHQKLSAQDIYIIESQAYHADFKRMVTHYDELRRSSGCELNLDLQRLAMPTSGIAYKPEPEAAGFNARKQGQWILQGLNIERIVVESVEDGIIMRQVSDKPVIHVAELAGSA